MARFLKFAELQFDSRKVAPYTGNPEDFDKFKSNFEIHADSMNWDANRKRTELPILLEGTAREWYYQEIQHEVDGSTKTYDQVMKMLEDYFCPDENTRLLMLEQKLAKLKQGSQSCAVFFLQVRTLCEKINPQMTEKEKMRHLYKTMNLQIAKKAYEGKPSTVEELFERAKSIESALSFFKEGISTQVLEEEMDAWRVNHDSERYESREDFLMYIGEEGNDVKDFPCEVNDFTQSRNFTRSEVDQPCSSRNVYDNSRYSEHYSSTPIQHQNECESYRYGNGAGDDPSSIIAQNGSEHQTENYLNENKYRRHYSDEYDDGTQENENYLEENDHRRRQENENYANERREYYSDDEENRFRQQKKSNLIYLKLTLNHEYPFEALVDTGAEKTVISKTVADWIDPVYTSRIPNSIYSSSGDRLQVQGEAMVDIRIQVSNFEMKTINGFPALVVKDFPCDVCLGADFNSHAGIIIHPRTKTVTFDN